MANGGINENVSRGLLIDQSLQTAGVDESAKISQRTAEEDKTAESLRLMFMLNRKVFAE